jgi:transcriptional regulator of acetoin/glycerol metabolism
MNVFTAHDLQTADLLAPARLDDDGVPLVVTLPRPCTYLNGSAPRPPSRAAPVAPPGPARVPAEPDRSTGRAAEGMSCGARARPEVSDDSRLAQARERFLTSEPIEPGQVRDTILASWRRCREWHVAAGRIGLSYVRDPDLDTPLARNALPVLQSLRESLLGEPVSVILTDAHGVALSRLTADHDLERHLDSIQLAPGFSYAEEFAGTNGIGTALESGRAAHVFGHEHYAEQLGDLADAGVPIRHPISGKVIGAVNLTCWRKNAGRLLIALAQSTAGQVAQGLLNDSSAEEFQLLAEYLRACRYTGGLVFALASDMVLMNGQARDTLDPADQAAVLGRAAEALAGDHPGLADVDLPTGARARIRCRPLRGQGTRRLVGGVVHVKLLEPASQAAADARAGPQARRFGPALAGSGPLWLRGCSQVETACASREWLSLAGEPGTGKLSAGAATRPARSTCWTPPRPVITTGWCGRSASCSRAREAWSSGTPTGSAPCGCAPCG